MVVQAIDKSGREFPLKLRNIEDGRVENVTIWGEKVPHEVYLRVKKDKIDNGIVDNSNSNGLENRYIAEKKKGYINTKQIMQYNSGKPLERTGQLTREENNWRKG